MIWLGAVWRCNFVLYHLKRKHETWPISVNISLPLRALAIIYPTVYINHLFQVQSGTLLYNGLICHNFCYNMLLVTLVTWFKIVSTPIWTGSKIHRWHVDSLSTEKNTMSMHSVTLVVPRVRTSSYENFKLWNALPAHIRDSKTLNIFKMLLKTNLFSSHFDL